MENIQNNSAVTSKVKGHAGALESSIAPVFAKAPHLPQGWVKILTDIAPWLSLICGVFGVIGFLGILSAGSMLSSVDYLGVMGGGSYRTLFYVTGIFGLISGVLYLLAFNPLRKMEKKGWDYMFYALILSVISTIVTIIIVGSGISSVVGVILGAYILFEVRGMYK